MCCIPFSLQPSLSRPKDPYFRSCIFGWISHVFLSAFGLTVVSRLSPSVQHLAFMLAVVLFASRISNPLIADGDPVAGVVAGRFLIADRIPRGSIFFRSVILILEHDRRGSFGVIINNQQGVGGPVPSLIPIVLTGCPARNVANVSGVEGLFWRRGHINEGGDNVENIGIRGLPDTQKVIHGISGWAERQLDGEVRRGSWRLADADALSVLAAHSGDTLWQTLFDRSLVPS